MNKHIRKLTPQQRQKLAVMKIQAKRRANFDRSMSGPVTGISNIGTQGSFIKNSHPPFKMRPANKYC